MDFTIKKYISLIEILKYYNFQFDTLNNLIAEIETKTIFLRHDVDRIPYNSYILAKIEYELGVNSTFYFRSIKGVFNEKIIKKVSELGHEIGYHYEDLSLAKGDTKKAIQLFEQNLNKFREIADIKTICMHGSPLSKCDNRAIWNVINYKDYGIILEPYFDIDYTKFFYITDTGRRWNQSDVNIRDKVNTDYNIRIKNTNHLISLIENNQLPKNIIINTHPHRWFDPGPMWLRELVYQGMKNVIKKGLNKIKK